MRSRTRSAAAPRRRAPAAMEREAFLLVQRTGKELRQQVAEVLKPAGITTAKFNVLRILREAGTAGLPGSVISERLVEHDPDVTRLLDRLEASGWVERARDAQDRRVVRARVTRAGLGILQQLDDRIADLHARQFGHLARDELDLLMTLLERVRAAR